MQSPEHAVGVNDRRRARAVARIAVSLLVICASAAVQRKCLAEIWIDPQPRMSWAEMLGCELVVVAKYEAHAKSRLTLRVLEVLKGDDPGESITAALEHLYSVETGTLAHDWGPDSKRDGIPKLCYKQQLFNPGDPKPVRAVADVRVATVYFFPRAGAPALVRNGQVQPGILTVGWRQAVQGKPMDVVFRLMQDVDPDVARGALEELAKSRDPDAIERLFYLVRHPLPPRVLYHFRADEPLARIGDRDGDVYDPAMKQGALSIAARVDSARALADFKGLLPQASDTERNAIGSALGYIPDKEAVRLALELLADYKATDRLPPALISLRMLFVENSAPDLFSEDTRAMLCEQGLPLVKQALETGKIPANYETEARHWVGDPPTVDLKVFREMLLNSSDRIDQVAMDLELVKAIQQAQRATDPRVIPILLEALNDVPEARGQHAFSIQEAILFYALVCRNAVRKEFLRLRLDRAIDPEHLDTPYQLRNLFKALGLDRPQPARSNLPSEATSTEELLAAVRASVEKAEDGNRARPIARLLESDDPRALQAYLSYLDDARRLVPDRFRSGKRLSQDYVELLNRLMPDHSAEFFERVQGLLQSDLQAERHVGVRALKSALGWSLGLDSEDVEAVRREKLKRVEPVLARLAGMTQEEIFRHLLEQHGFRLDGPKGEAWLPTLRMAASSCHSGVSRNALMLIRQILGEPDVIHLQHLPHGQRRRAVALLLDDRAHP